MMATAQSAPRVPLSKWQLRKVKFRYWSKNYAIPFAKARARHYASGLKSNVYSVFGLVCFCAAGYVHSLFAGLIVTGASWFALELKTRGT
jgi:hypothetical protein